MKLIFCRVDPAALPELTRLIAAGWLRELQVINGGVHVFDEAHETTRLFVAAVRASAMKKLHIAARWALVELPKNVVAAAAFINTRQQ